MDLKRLKEEMQFITGVITDDLEYLMYLLLKKNTVEEEEEEITKDEGYMKEDMLDDWFDNI